jgi:hypothetical protein
MLAVVCGPQFHPEIPQRVAAMEYPNGASEPRSAVRALPVANRGLPAFRARKNAAEFSQPLPGR